MWWDRYCKTRLPYSDLFPVPSLYLAAAMGADRRGPRVSLPPSPL